MNPQFLAAMRALYAALDADIAARAPVCTNRGACCKFESYGHRLYVTAAELAYFLAGSEGPLQAPPDRSFCPYQVGGQCTARTARPAGCRIYFCDAAAQGWQSPVTEDVLHRLAKLGDRFDIPYVYTEWTEALRELGGTVVPRPPAPDFSVPLRFDMPKPQP